MLLTKPLTSFLHSNLSPQVHTLLIITPSGKLLASSSTLIPASLLRSQATLASTLWSLYRPHTIYGTISATLPESPHAEPNYESDDSQSGPAATKSDPDVSSILIQLENGTMLVKALQSSLLFIAIGPSSSSAPPHPHTMTATAPAALAAAAAATASGKGGSAIGSSQSLHGQAQDLAHLSVTPEGGSSLRDGIEGVRSPRFGKNYAASDAGSTNTAGGGGRSLRRMKRMVEELAGWLDEELVGFRLGETL